MQRLCRRAAVARSGGFNIIASHYCKGTYQPTTAGNSTSLEAAAPIPRWPFRANFLQAPFAGTEPFCGARYSDECALNGTQPDATVVTRIQDTAAQPTRKGNSMKPKWLLLVACSLALSVTNLGAAEPLKVGDKAPDFKLTGSDGKTYQLSDFTGKSAVILAWYPRAFTGGCTKECASLKQYGDQLRQYNVAYFTASTDPVDKNTDFAKSLELDYPVLSDPDAKVAKAYGVYNEERNFAARTTFIIGKDGKILHIDREVNTAEHGADLAKKLAELKIEKRAE